MIGTLVARSASLLGRNPTPFLNQLKRRPPYPLPRQFELTTDGTPMGPNEVNTAIDKQGAHIRQLNDELAQMHRQQDGAAACIGLKLLTEWVSAQLEHERCCNTTVEQRM